MAQEVLERVDQTLINSLKAPPLDPVLLSVANEYLKGTSIPAIANLYDVTPDIVSQIIDQKEVKSYIDNIFLNQGFMNRFKRLEIINEVITKKLQDSMESGEEYSKKDLLEWIKEVNKMENDIKPKEKTPTVAVQVNNNYDNLIERLLSEDK
tara:strand:- start:473 stop:928 length:456 start_codon:yes stop_codon:yes gene_type:complete